MSKVVMIFDDDEVNILTALVHERRSNIAHGNVICSDRAAQDDQIACLNDILQAFKVATDTL